jgi:hypothetical protein
MVKENGDSYEGVFERGEFKEGKMKTATYQGEIKDFKRCGEGVYTDAQGNVYTGHFEKNKYNG